MVSLEIATLLITLSHIESLIRSIQIFSTVLIKIDTNFENTLKLWQDFQRCSEPVPLYLSTERPRNPAFALVLPSQTAQDTSPPLK